MPLTKEQARTISRNFLELSHELGSYRFANWDRLTPSQRQQIESIEWDVLNYSSSFITTAVGITLGNLQDDLRVINEATSQAKKVVATIQEVKDVLQIAAGVVMLGGAIASRNPSAIAGAAQDLWESSQKVLAKKKSF